MKLNLKYQLYLMFFSLVALNSSVYAQWEKIYGKTKAGDKILAIATQDSIILAGTDFSGIFRSADNGETWTSYLNNEGITSIAIFDSVVFARSHDYRLYLSIDSGTKWEKISDINASTHSYFQVIDSTLYVESFDTIYTSNDKGRSWTKKKISNFYGIIISDTYIFGRLTNSIFRSNDEGENWAQLDLPNDETIQTIFYEEDMLYCVTSSNILRSSDYGDNWETLLTINNSFFHKIVSSRSNILVETNKKEFLISTDKGNSWKNIEIDVENNAMTTFSINNSDIIVGTSPGMLFKSSVDLISWSKIFSVDLSQSVFGLFVQNSNFISSFEDGFYYSNDNGENWMSSNLKLGYSAIAWSDSAVFVKSSSDFYRSIDDGETWAQIDSISHYNFLSCYSKRNSNCEDFINIDNIEWINSSKLWRLRCFEKYDSTIIAGVWGVGIVISNDGGSNWHKNNEGLMFERHVNDIDIYDSNVFAGSTNGGIFRFDFDDNIWIAINKGLPRADVEAMAFVGSNIFIGTRYGIYHSKNNGESWIDMNENLNYPHVTSLAVKEQYLYVSTIDHGLYRHEIEDNVTSLENDHDLLPESFLLEQNYPNPFNPTTTIKYSLSKQSMVNLCIYNMLGQEITNLINNEIQSVGNYSLFWNAGHLSSGVYLLRAEVQSLTDNEKHSFTRKMLLIK